MYRTLRVLGLSVLVLLALGFVVLASAGSANGMRLFRDPYHFVVRQALWFGVAAVPCFIAALKIDYHFWRNRKWVTVLLYMVMVALLVAVLFAEATKGSKRWIGHGMFRLQPSEFAKLGVVIAVSVYLDRLGWMLGKFWKGAVPAALLVALPLGLVLVEPDFGATLVIGAASASIFLLAGMRMLHIGFFGIIGAVAVGVLLWHNPNRMNRIRSWVNTTVQSEATKANQAENEKFVVQGTDLLKTMVHPGDIVSVAQSVLSRTRDLDGDMADKIETEIGQRLRALSAKSPADPDAQKATVSMLSDLADRKRSREKEKSAAYQLDQALVAIQRGGVGGVGYTKSMQKRLYLPENHTDFIFAIGAEELGLGFSLGLLGLFCTFFACGMIIAARAPDRLGRLIATGASFLIFFQALFNLAVVTGCAPTKGIALPFISYGGTNLISAMIAVGLLFNVGRQIELPKSRPRSTISPVFSQQGVQ